MTLPEPLVARNDRGIEAGQVALDVCFLEATILLYQFEHFQEVLAVIRHHA